MECAKRFAPGPPFAALCRRFTPRAMSGCDASIVPPRVPTKRDPQFKRVSKLLTAWNAILIHQADPERLLRIGHRPISGSHQGSRRKRLRERTGAGRGVHHGELWAGAISVRKQIVAALVELTKQRKSYATERRARRTHNRSQRTRGGV